MEDELNFSNEKRIKYCGEFNKINSSFSCIIGENELKNNEVSVKNMFTKEIFNVSLNNFEEEFINIFRKI